MEKDKFHRILHSIKTVFIKQKIKYESNSVSNVLTHYQFEQLKEVQLVKKLR